jgi:hypothetical protein
MEKFCPKQHLLNYQDTGRSFTCDVCKVQHNSCSRLCCTLTDCNYDVCAVCETTAKCPAGHLLQRQESNEHFHCDVCLARNTKGLRLCCKTAGCDFDICADCMKTAKCEVGHFLQRHDSDQKYICSVCSSMELSGQRLMCKMAICEYYICPSCMNTGRCPGGHFLLRWESTKL